MEKIQLLGTEEDLDNGFYIIMTSGESSLCLRNETYIVNENVINRLKKEKIKFKEV